MSTDRALRKKQRSVLNTIREACIYGSAIFLNDGWTSHPVVPLELHEKGYRDLDGMRRLVIRKARSA